MVVGDDADVREVQIGDRIEHGRGDRPGGDQEHRFAVAAIGHEHAWPTARPQAAAPDARARWRSRDTPFGWHQLDVAAGDLDAVGLLDDRPLPANDTVPLV